MGVDGGWGGCLLHGKGDLHPTATGLEEMVHLGDTVLRIHTRLFDHILDLVHLLGFGKGNTHHTLQIMGVKFLETTKGENLVLSIEAFIHVVF